MPIKCVINASKLLVLFVARVCVCVTFLSHRAPDGDDEDADDGENQKRQDAPYHRIWYCAVSLHHCTGI